MGQGHGFRTQPVNLLLVHPILVEEQTHADGAGQSPR